MPNANYSFIHLNVAELSLASFLLFFKEVNRQFFHSVMKNYKLCCLQFKILRRQGCFFQSTVTFVSESNLRHYFADKGTLAKVVSGIRFLLVSIKVLGFFLKFYF